MGNTLILKNFKITLNMYLDYYLKMTCQKQLKTANMIDLNHGIFCHHGFPLIQRAIRTQNGRRTWKVPSSNTLDI